MKKALAALDEHERMLIETTTSESRDCSVAEMHALAAFDIANSLRIMQFGISPLLEAVSDVEEEDKRPRHRLERIEECVTAVMDSDSTLGEDQRSSIIAELHALSMADISNTLRARLFGTRKKSEE